MVTSFNSKPPYYTYNGEQYERKSEGEKALGLFLATAASGVVLKALPSFSNPFLKQIKEEHANNHLYKDAFFKSYEQSGLKDQGLKVVSVFFKPGEEERYKLSPKGIELGDVKAGLNAFYVPEKNSVVLNTEKATITGFHEFGHAMNNLQSKFGKVLGKMRAPGYSIAALMGTVAIFFRHKPKDADRNAWDWLQDNCGKIAFIGMLPTVAEEGLASYKGIKLAKNAGLDEALVKNLKKFYGKALLSYAGYAFLIGFSTYIASKITEFFTRPTKVEYQNDNIAA